jgi:hypothetical protein
MWQQTPLFVVQLDPRPSLGGVRLRKNASQVCGTALCGTVVWRPAVALSQSAAPYHNSCVENQGELLGLFGRAAGNFLSDKRPVSPALSSKERSNTLRMIAVAYCHIFDRDMRQ